MTSSLEQLSALPSPPTSPTSPRAATARIRIKAAKRPLSVGNIPSPGFEANAERTTSMPPISLAVMTDQDSLGVGITMTPLGNARAIAAKRTRRQSSITYYTPSSPAPWNQRPQPKRTSSSSADHDGESILANGNGNLSKRSSLVLSSRSPSARESVSSLDVAGARERDPLTLVEKHADLLHFIAQKERKCLELRDQLAAHEKELTELKCNWERVVNRGHDPLPNSPASIGGVALDGLKEGVRMIAAGFSDLGGVTQEPDTIDGASKHKTLSQAPRETNNARTKRGGSEHLSMSSMSSIQESTHASDHVLEEGETATVAIAPSLSRTVSINSRIHRRTSRIAQEPTTPTNASVSSSSPTQSPKSANLDAGMSFVLAPSPTLVPPMLGAIPVAPTTSTPKSPMNANASTHGAGPVSSWMDNMGKKLNELQRGQTFSKSQKRASLLLAGVSSTISAALSPGPTATTPAPVPTSVLTTTSTPRLSTPVSTKSPQRARQSLRQLPSQPESEFDTRPYPSYKSMADWLDDDEEQTVHAGGVLIPDEWVQPHRIRDDVGSETAYAAVSSFDDDWNW